MIRIVVVEDNEVVRTSLVRLLSAQEDMEIVAQAANGLEAVHLLESKTSTDIMLTDLNMPVMGGIEMTKRLTGQFPELKVIILTMHTKSVFAEEAKKAGAKGFVLKHTEIEDLYSAIRAVYTGENYYSA